MTTSKNKIALGLATAAVGLVSTNNVFAAENNTWTGFSVKGGINYSTLKANEQFNATADSTNTWYTSAKSTDSAVSAILGLGYDFQVSDKFVVGVFGDYNFAKPKTSSKQISETTNNTYTMAYSTKIKDAFSLGLKLGYALDDNNLLYASVGASTAKVETKASIYDSDGNGNSAANSNRKTGHFIGLGLEHKVDNNLSLVADYRYTDFGKFEATNSSNDNPVSLQSNAKTQNLSLSLKYKF